MSDPFEPDWSKAPAWADWHTVDADNVEYWWEFPPIIGWSSNEGADDDIFQDWWPNREYNGALGGAYRAADPSYEPETEEAFLARQHAFQERGQLDWRNSLRHRPGAK